MALCASFRTFAEYISCEVIATPNKYDTKPYAYGFQKDSPYLGIFNYYLKDMREKGTLKQIQKKFESQPQVCPDYSGKPLGFDSCFTAFCVLLFGMAVGFLFWICECLSGLCGLKVPCFDSYGNVESSNQSSTVPLAQSPAEDFIKETLFQTRSKETMRQHNDDYKDLVISRLKSQVNFLQMRLNRYEPLYYKSLYFSKR